MAGNIRVLGNQVKTKEYNYLTGKILLIYMLLKMLYILILIKMIKILELTLHLINQLLELELVMVMVLIKNLFILVEMMMDIHLYMYMEELMELPNTKFLLIPQ
jgi:hypothetical protein